MSESGRKTEGETRRQRMLREEREEGAGGVEAAAAAGGEGRRAKVFLSSRVGAAIFPSS